MPWQVAQIYEFQRHGWQEVYYSAAGTAEQAASLIPSSQQTMLAPRPPGTVLKGIRVVDVYNPRIGVYRPLGTVRGSYAPGAGSPMDETERAPDVSQTAIMLRLGAAAGPSRPIFIRGLRDTLVKRYDDGLPNWSAISSYISAIFKVITGESGQNPYAIRSTKPVSQAVAAKVPVKTVVRIDDGKARLNLEAADYTLISVHKNFVFDGGQTSKVIVQGGSADWHDMPGLKGIFRVLQWDDATNSIVIPYRVPLQSNATYGPKKMTVRNLYYDFNAITEYSRVDFRTRDTGRPTGLSRGRSRKAQSRT
jgi:hypothetical protein